jgi:hypothetical protein
VGIDKTERYPQIIHNPLDFPLRLRQYIKIDVKVKNKINKKSK